MTISTSTTKDNPKRSNGRALGAGLVLVVLLALALSTLIAQATNHELSVAGYADFSYEIPPPPPPDEAEQLDEPTGKEAQSKVWWNDGFWWAVMFNNTTLTHHIYQLDAVNQEWIDTGVAVDDRPDTGSDVLWDGSKLYVASHIKVNNAVFNNNPANSARLYRFSYDSNTDTYDLDDGFPVDIARYQAESLVLDKDSTGRLWITFVAYDGRDAVPSHKVRINYSGEDDTDWNPGSPFVPPVGVTSVISDDISSLVAFTDGTGPKIGVMWSNQDTNQFYFAYHADSDNPEAGWTLDANFTAAFPSSTYPADDHINFAPAPDGTLFAVTKTNNMPGPEDDPEPPRRTIIEADSDPLVGVMARNPAGNWTYIPVSPAASLDTRPVAIVDSANDKLHVFTVSKPTTPHQVCIHTADIVSPLANMTFDADNCEPPAGEAAGTLASLLELTAATPFIGDTNTYTDINSPSTVKGWVGGASGLLVLASDQPNMYYVHNHEPGSVAQPTLTPTATTEGTPTGTPTSTGVPPTSTPTATPTDGPTPTATSTIPPTHQDSINLPIIIDDLD